MSIANVNGVTGSSRAGSAVSDPTTSTTPARQTGAEAAVEIDQVTQQPLPPRFPWLSRLSQQLEQASGQKPAFAPAPVLGDHVDRSA